MQILDTSKLLIYNNTENPKYIQ